LGNSGDEVIVTGFNGLVTKKTVNGVTYDVYTHSDANAGANAELNKSSKLSCRVLLPEPVISITSMSWMRLSLILVRSRVKPAPSSLRVSIPPPPSTRVRLPVPVFWAIVVMKSLSLALMV
jgi:hypothetical protein